ncbi:MAG: UbiA prenyltransferase family protein [Planctomycetales bacterium]|nr:UbiA prenyltransferase family protein [Planctomycetales bacterium]
MTDSAADDSVSTHVTPSTRFWGHVKIARFDHWVKNVFVLPGIIAAMSVAPAVDYTELAISCVVGLLSVGMVASSNYVINELLDASYDLAHPIKKHRPVPSGQVSVPIAYAQWIVMMLIGMALALCISRNFAITMAALWLMGCIYNIPPIRTKERPYLDILSEAVNNPLRLLAGWYIVGVAAVPPASLLLSYWMVGCYFMAIKRFAELRDLPSREVAATYRASFAYYTNENLLISIMFYASASMLFLGTFAIRYRVEWILAYPLIALVMAVYLHIAFKPNSPAQAPERLYREPMLMASVISCAVLLGVLLFVDLPWLHTALEPTLTTVDQSTAP